MSRRRPRGFTLLELVVALALFATVAALAYGGLDALVRAGGQLDARMQRLSAMQRAVDLVVRDLRQAVPRGVRDRDGRVEPALAGDRSGLVLTRGGFGNALALPRAELERVGFAVVDGRLERRRYAVLDRADGREPRQDVLLEDAGALAWRYLGHDGRWHDEWPPRSGTARALPRAVEFRLALAAEGEQGELHRLVELPGGAP